MRIGIITDAHLGPPPRYFGKHRIMSDEAESALGAAVVAFNDHLHPDLIVQLGDLVQERRTAPDRDEDLANLDRALDLLAAADAPVRHVVGNHEQVTLSPTDLVERLGGDALYSALDVGELHVVTLLSSTRAHTEIRVSPEQLDWLAADLAATTRDTLVFIHHPLVEHDLTDHYWFKGLPPYAFVENRDAVRGVLEASGRVRAVFNGHMHVNHCAELNGIAHVTVQSLVEDFADAGTPARAYAVVDVSDDAIAVEVFGNDPARWRMTRSR